MEFVLAYNTILALVIAFVYLHRYGNFRKHPLVCCLVFVAWFFAILMVFLIPIDVTVAVYRQCVHDINDTTITNVNETIAKKCPNPFSWKPDIVLPSFWRIIYWTCQLWTWLIMPMIQSYLKAGDFVVKGKLKAALIDNLMYYGSYLLICAILLIYLALKPGVHLDWQKLKAIASSASNTWGLFLLVLLLGYALVDVPRSLWNHARPGYTLQLAYFQLAKMSAEKTEAEEDVEDILDTLNAVSKAVPLSHPLRPCIETIMQKVPLELTEKLSKLPSGYDPASTIVPSEKTLIRLHRQVIKTMQIFQRTRALWSVQVTKVIFFEEVAANTQSKDRRFKSGFPPHGRCGRLFQNPIILWWTYCYFRTPFLKLSALVAATFSFIIVWSELTFFTQSPTLSILAILINVAKDGYALVFIKFVLLTFLGYLSYCTVRTIMKVKFFNLYYLAPHHQTNAHSLIFSGMLLCRLIPPLCLNFLGMIHMDSHIIKTRILETYYTQVMGHMDVIGIIADGFNIYFPMLMLAFCLATWFSLGSRTLNALGVQQFMLNESISLELVQEGRDLIAREKRRQQRAEESLARRREYSSRIGGERGGAAAAGTTTGTTSIGGDGLLRDGEPIDYSSNRQSSFDMDRSLSQEINERFGTSTSVQVEYRDGFDIPESSDGERRVGPPPKRIFDDV